jgi:hypothetical protein
VYVQRILEFCVHKTQLRRRIGLLNLTRTATLTALVSISACAFATNLLPNGDFSSATQITGWSNSRGANSWSSDDANGSPSSGSLQTQTDAVGDPEDTISACFAVTPSAAYSYGGETRQIGQTGATVLFTCTSYLVAGCLGNVHDLSPVPLMSVTTMWPSLAASASGTLPANAQSVNCATHVDNALGGTAETVHFDNLFFDSTAPAVPVRLQSFEVR